MFQSWGQIAEPEPGQKPGWFHLRADEAIADYYQWLYSRAFKKWSPCMNGCHVTFIAGEKDDRIVSVDEMKPFMDKDILFTYSPVIYTNGAAFWLPALSYELDVIRIKLDLRPRLLYHITLGNVKNG